MVLPDSAGAVAAAAEPLHIRVRIERGRYPILPEVGVVRVQSHGHGQACGNTQRTGCIAAVEADALGRQPIHVRRPEHWMAGVSHTI